MGPRAVGTAVPSGNWTPERPDLGGPRFGVRRVLRRSRRPYVLQPIRAGMGNVGVVVRREVFPDLRC